MLETTIKFFILLTPFFVLAVFLSLTEGVSRHHKKDIAVKTCLAIIIICLIVYFAGNYILNCLNLTLDAFRVGAGTLLFLSGVNMVRGDSDSSNQEHVANNHNIAVIPLALPCAIGPGTVGALLLLGGDKYTDLAIHLKQVIGIIVAGLSVGIILWFANYIENLIGKKGINFLSKLTGLFLVSLASQIIMQGIKNFFSDF